MDTNTHLLSDIGDTLATSLFWLYRKTTTDPDTHFLTNASRKSVSPVVRLFPLEFFKTSMNKFKEIARKEVYVHTKVSQ
jgi:hypothetical protein